MLTREEKFEKMLADVQTNYQATAARMEALKAQGREKSATYRQLMGNKLTYRNLLDLYKIYGLLDEENTAP